ncbi:MAG: hypothetical protein B5M52_05130 [Helicobacteraceae bacterium 4484_230]|nr:MAG: hypothetical protein B5M52_05130 [Helicobacteraceae bacterium 4484_230]
MHRSEYFDYKVPYWSEIKKQYDAPYKFKKDFTDKVDALFSSPRHRWSKKYTDMRWDCDANMMAQVLYRYVRYARDNMASIGGSMENISPQVTVTMWKKLLGLHKTYKRTVIQRFYAAHVARLHARVADLMEEMVRIQDEKDYWWHYTDMRKNKKVHSPASLKEGGRHFEYLASLE